MDGGLVQPLNLILTAPDLQLRGESSLFFESCNSLPQPPQKKPDNYTALSLQHMPQQEWETRMGGEAICHSLRVLETQQGSHLEPAEMTTPMPRTHCGGSLEASSFRLLKLENINLLPLLFSLYIQLHILGL